jgi:hypothetical protein
LGLEAVEVIDQLQGETVSFDAGGARRLSEASPSRGRQAVRERRPPALHRRYEPRSATSDSIRQICARAGPLIRCDRYRWASAADNGMAMDRRDIDAELERVTADFHRLLDSATGAELGMPTNGTKWTNKQLLFHMLFGFIVVRALLPLVKGFGRLPPAASHVRRDPERRDPSVPRRQLPERPSWRNGPGQPRHGETHGQHDRASTPPPRPGVRAHTRTRDALPDRLGSLLQGRYDGR